MTDVDKNDQQDNLQSAPPKKPRAIDHGADILPDMEMWVQLVRKVRLHTLLTELLNATTPELADLPVKRSPKRLAVLPPAERKDLFLKIAALTPASRAQLEYIADLIMTLTDEFGAMAVQSMLNEHDVADVLQPTVDATSRALYLYLRYAHPAPGASADARFLRAEHVQSMNRCWRSEKCSSHYKGPKGTVPCVTEPALDALKLRILTFYPQLTADDIQIEHYTRRDLDSDDEAAVLHTITATFNGGQAQFKQVQQGDVIDRVEPAAIDISYCWDPRSGLLSVYSEDGENRQAFATAFRDELLARAGNIEDMPMREFNLKPFLDAAILEKLSRERIPGVSQIVIQYLMIAKIEEQATIDPRSGRPIQRQIVSPLTIGRDRHDFREVYEVAQQAHGIHSLLDYDPLKVKMTLFMAARPHHAAHRVTVLVTAPNGLSDRCKTEEDRRQVLAQLSHLGIMREF